MHRPLLSLTPALLLLTIAATALAQDDEPSAYDKVRAAAMQRYEANRKATADNNDMFVRPGVIADKQKKQVKLDAIATGLPADDPVEFFVIPEGSGKDYEALTVTYAKASDIDAAMKFIGMKPGRPVNFNRLVFWSKGERAKISFQWGEGEGRTVPAEQFVFDRRTKKPMPVAGFVYTGSYWLEDRQGDRRLAADVLDSRSIASNYNERASLFDVPRQSAQGDVYSFYSPNPKLLIAKDTPVNVIIEPINPGNPRVVDLALEIKQPKAAGDAKLSDLRFTLLQPVEEGEPKSMATDAQLPMVVTEFAKLIEADRDPYVQLRWTDSVDIRLLRQTVGVLQSAEGERGIRLEPPAEGHFFHGAFTPNAKWADRGSRLFSALELSLVRNGGKVKAKLAEPNDRFTPDAPPTKTRSEHNLADPDALVTTIDKLDPIGRKALIIYAQPGLTYGELRHWCEAVLAKKPSDQPTMYVFTRE